MRNLGSGNVRSVIAALFAALTLLSCESEERLDLVISVAEPSVSRLPYVIAYDQGLFAKHGLDVDLRLQDPESGENVSHTGAVARILRWLRLAEMPAVEIMANGLGPGMLRSVESVGQNRYVIGIASTDCVLRAHIVARAGLRSLDDLKGGRLGVSNLASTAGMHALVLARRLGWDPVQDISIMSDADDDIAMLLDGRLDGLVAYERAYADALREGLPILADTKDWNEILAGNSARVARGWLDDEANREKARRFVRALAEAIAIFHDERETALDVMEKWYGFDRAYAEDIYSRGAWIPRKPYPCVEGLERTAELYDSNAMRNTRLEDFYDDRFVREMDESGYFETLSASLSVPD